MRRHEDAMATPGENPGKLAAKAGRTAGDQPNGGLVIERLHQDHGDVTTPDMLKIYMPAYG
jgi:hypothetical protein